MREDVKVIRSIIDVQKICKGCKYYSSAGCCDYYLETKQRRGCKIGECDKYEKGKRGRASIAPPFSAPKTEIEDYYLNRR